MRPASHPAGHRSGEGRTPRRPAHVVADQSEVAAFLADPASHGIAGPVKRFETHGALVFLAGDDAYKLKRAVKFPFMDFSTPDKRRAACEAEVAVNRPNAPGLYLGVLPVTRSADGRLALGGAGEAVDWVVHMRRFDEERTLDRVAASDGLSDALIAGLVAAVLASHARAPVRPGGPAVRALARYLGENAEAFAESPELFPPERAAALSSAAASRLGELEPLLLARGRAGWVRRCHGDLHLRNLVLIDGEPRYSTENHVGDFPVIMPAIDVTSIGAGGGSIAWIDPGGVLRVGPESAGAEPGPVCYGQGGTRPTVTDADLVLGYLNPVALLDGALPVDLARARTAIEREIGRPLGLGPPSPLRTFALDSHVTPKERCMQPACKCTAPPRRSIVWLCPAPR